jgi:hypothetical protein
VRDRTDKHEKKRMMILGNGKYKRICFEGEAGVYFR